MPGTSEKGANRSLLFHSKFTISRVVAPPVPWMRVRGVADRALGTEAECRGIERAGAGVAAAVSPCGTVPRVGDTRAGRGSRRGGGCAMDRGRKGTTLRPVLR